LRRAEVEIGGMLAVDGLSTPASPTWQGHIESVPQPRRGDPAGVPRTTDFG
jgi:hypothetical protein